MRHALLLLLAAVVLAGCQLPPAGKHNVALLYGVADYNAVGVRDLPYPDQDALGLADALNRNNGGGFQTTVHVDAEATAQQIRDDFAVAAATLDADSMFLFYFAGHGQTGALTGAPTLQGHTAIFPQDSFVPTGNGSGFLQAIRANVITEDDLRDLLDTLPTKKVIVIMDACFTGGFIQGVGSDGTPQDAEGYYTTLWKAFLNGEAPDSAEEVAEWLHSIIPDHSTAMSSWETSVANGSGISSSRAQLLTAAGALEESYDSLTFPHGAFTYFLLEAKTKGDFDGNGVVTVSEAYRYTFANIQTRWNGLWGAVGQGSFFVDYNPNSGFFLPHLSTGPNDYVLFR